MVPPGPVSCKLIHLMIRFWATCAHFPSCRAPSLGPPQRGVPMSSRGDLFQVCDSHYSVSSLRQGPVTGTSSGASAVSGAEGTHSREKGRGRWKCVAESGKSGKMTVDLHQQALSDTPQGYGPGKAMGSGPLMSCSCEPRPFFSCQPWGLWAQQDSGCSPDSS